MSANVENMMSVREVPWHGLGTIVDEAPTAAEAMKLAGLDWQVYQRPIICDGLTYAERVGNVREWIDPDFGFVQKNVLGIVSPKYRIVQNADAFDFFDSLIGTEVRYETAGCIDFGKQVFLTAKTEKSWFVADDEISTYMLLTNGHDGFHQLKAAITPVRVVCQNTLVYGLESAKRLWSMTHHQNINDKIREARHALGLTARYMAELVEFGNRAADQKVSPATIEAMADAILKPEVETKQSAKTLQRRKSVFEKCLYAPDIKPYRGTVWGVLNAVSDYETHYIGTPNGRMKRTLNDQLQLMNRAKDFLMQGV